MSRCPRRNRTATSRAQMALPAGKGEKIGQQTTGFNAKCALSMAKMSLIPPIREQLPSSFSLLESAKFSGPFSLDFA